MDRNERREISGEVNYGLGQGTKIAIVITLLVVLLGGVVWGISVATSKVRGQGDAYSQKNSAENWTKAQADFNQRYQAILAFDRNINQAYAAKKEDPENERLKIEYNGLVRACNSAVGEYNTKARSYLSKDFKDSDLPSEISTTNPQTDCKENSK